MAAFITALLPLVETEGPAVLKAFEDLNKGGGFQKFLSDLAPTLKKAAPAIASATGSGATPTVTFYLPTPGTYNVTVTVAEPK
jgi:hypothetical protein